MWDNHCISHAQMMTAKLAQLLLAKAQVRTLRYSGDSETAARCSCSIKKHAYVHAHVTQSVMHNHNGTVLSKRAVGFSLEWERA